MQHHLARQRKETRKFESLPDFLSEYLTPEGLELLNHWTGKPPDYARQRNANTLFEVKEAYAMTNSTIPNHIRLVNGLSTITQALKVSAAQHGAKLYDNEEVKSIDKYQGKQFKLITTKYTVIANKLVLAIPVSPMKRLQGSVIERIKRDATFDSIGFGVAFKGFAVFKDAWWQRNSTGRRYLADEQEMLSNSDCLGRTFPFK